MISRIFSLVLGLALVALAVLINRPDIYGPTAPHLALGPYEAWRQVVGMVVGGMGAVIFIAAIVRQGVPKKRARDSMTFDEPAPVPASSSSDTFTIHDSTTESSPSRGGTAVAAPLW